MAVIWYGMQCILCILAKFQKLCGFPFCKDDGMVWYGPAGQNGGDCIMVWYGMHTCKMPNGGVVWYGMGLYGMGQAGIMVVIVWQYYGMVWYAYVQNAKWWCGMV